VFDCPLNYVDVRLLSNFPTSSISYKSFL
jgi:hypothetical protein